MIRFGYCLDSMSIHNANIATNSTDYQSKLTVKAGVISTLVGVKHPPYFIQTKNALTMGKSVLVL